MRGGGGKNRRAKGSERFVFLFAVETGAPRRAPCGERGLPAGRAPSEPPTGYNQKEAGRRPTSRVSLRNRSGEARFQHSFTSCQSQERQTSQGYTSLRFKQTKAGQHADGVNLALHPGGSRVTEGPHPGPRSSGFQS